MTMPREGHHDLFAQIPDVIWEKLCDDAECKGVSVTKRLTEILRVQYDVPLAAIPKPRRSGPKPKQRGFDPAANVLPQSSIDPEVAKKLIENLASQESAKPLPDRVANQSCRVPVIEDWSSLKGS